MSNTIMDDRASISSPTGLGVPATDADGNPLAEQASKLKGILFARDTVTTLGQSLRLIFDLLRESLVLLWLALCWGIVAIGWLGTKATQTGQHFKQQWKTFQENHQEQTASDIATEASKSVVTSSKTVMKQILMGAKKQVGLEENSNIDS